MSYLPDLRSSLVQAAERNRTTTVSARLPVARRRGWRRRTAAGLRSTPILLSVLVAVGIATLALAQLGHGGRPVRPSTAPTAVPSQLRPLYDILGVLRRPQTYADLHTAPVVRWLKNEPGRPTASLGTPDMRLIRRAAVTPAGSVFLIPELPLTPAARARVERRLAAQFGGRAAGHLASRPLPTGLFVLVGNAGGAGGSCCVTASQVRSGGVMTSGGEQSPNGPGYTNIAVVVPDGVAKVAFLVAAGRRYTSSGAIVRWPSKRVLVAVHGNAVGVHLDHPCCSQVAMIWYAADGSALKRIGNPGVLHRPATLPRPAPETPRSRAAERNPATPNPVSVTPAVGSPQTAFALGWVNLLSFADYRFQITGPPSTTGCTGASGLRARIAPLVSQDNLRGRRISAPLAGAGPRPLCPGTYRAAVAITAQGTTYAPFGTATFTVR